MGWVRPGFNSRQPEVMSNTKFKKKTEDFVVDLAGAPTYGGLKKSILKIGLEKGLSPEELKF